jgi:hypothetical protein
MTNPRTFSFVARMTGVFPCSVYCSIFEASKAKLKSLTKFTLPA